MVETLIKDVANWDVVADNRFPRLRNFDPYAGHSWANGHGSGWMGNDQESTSESINFSTALILWGANTCNNTIRDLGIYMYTNEVAAIEQYWFDINNSVFPAGYNQAVIAILRGNGGQYSIFWDPPGNNVSEIHGINLLPVTGGSLYLGRNPAYINTFLNEMHTGSDMGGINGVWRDIFWEYEAFTQTGTYNASAAVARFNANSGYTPEPGESKAHTYHWINNLNKLGQLHTVNGNVPTSATFIKSGTICYVAFNPPCNGPTTVSFSNGASMSVASNELKVMCGLPLPIELLNFEGAFYPGQSAIFLKWTTASEKNNLGFEIYRKEKYDNTQDYILLSGFKSDQSLKGKNNANDVTNYTFWDYTAEEGKEYLYKLINVDFDGRSYEKVIDVSMDDLSYEIALKNYPNPFTHRTTIEFKLHSGENYQNIKISVQHVHGKEVSVFKDLTSNQFSFSAENLSAGIYYCILMINDVSVKVNYMIIIK